MRDASEEMRNATSDLRRQDPEQASARGSRALEKLRETQRQLEAARPDERRRALGEMQLEARQMADAQRQIASELARPARAKRARTPCVGWQANRSGWRNARESCRTRQASGVRRFERFKSSEGSPGFRGFTRFGAFARVSRFARPFRPPGRR